MSDKSGVIFDIQRFSVHNGPGIRTTVFLKGCSNACLWCHNPESILFQPDLQFYEQRCNLCGKCKEVCLQSCHILDSDKHNILRDRCIGCGLCAKNCTTQALVLSGKNINVKAIMKEIIEDKEYYRQSRGGVTLSGGEPVLQNEFCLEILKECKKENLHTIIQTAGNYEYSMLKNLLSFVDMVMYDIKAFSQRIYDEHIFGDRDTILKNLEKLSSENIPIIVRTPVVGSVNDSAEEISAICDFISDLKNIKSYELIPYHNLGNMKREALGKNNPFEYYSPSEKHMNILKDMVRKLMEV